MKSDEHKAIAQLYFEVAKSKDKEYEIEADPVKKKALMVVAAQNYFYGAINVIDFIFAGIKTPVHPFNHENRMRSLLEFRLEFNDRLIELFDKVDRDTRNKVAYRGENGKHYKLVKELANEAMKEI